MVHEESEDKKPENEQIDWRYTDVPVNTSPSSNCFIATAVYDSSHAPEVEALREFRDNVLKKNRVGRQIVDLYYSGLGECAAEIIKEQFPSTIPVIRIGLDYLVEKYQDKERW